MGAPLPHQKQLDGWQEPQWPGEQPEMAMYEFPECVNIHSYFWAWLWKFNKLVAFPRLMGIVVVAKASWREGERM